MLPEEGCENYPGFSSCCFMRTSWRRQHFPGCFNTERLWQPGPGWEVKGGGWDPGAKEASSRGDPQPHRPDVFLLAAARAGVMAIHCPGGKQAPQNPLRAMAAHPQGHDPSVSESFPSKPPPSSRPCTSTDLGPTKGLGRGGLIFPILIRQTVPRCLVGARLMHRPAWMCQFS